MAARHRFLLTTRILVLLVAFFIFLAFSEFSRNGPNPSSRFMLTKAIVLNGTLSIDKSEVEYYSGLDYAVKNGTYYLDKAPGLSFISIPFYFVGNELYKAGIVLPKNDAFNYGGDSNGFFFIILFTTFVSAFGVMKFYETLKLLNFSEKVSLASAFIFGLATLYFVFSSSLFSHSFLAAALIFSIYELLKYQKSGARSNILLSGTALGIAITIEYTIIIFLPIFLLYMFMKAKKIADAKKYSQFLAPVALIGLLLAAYNTATFGCPTCLSYNYSTFIDTQKFDHDIRDGLYVLLVSTYRGIFFFNPVLLLAIPGFYFLYKRREHEAIFFAMVVVAQVLLISSYSYLTGGLSYGPRHLIAIIPFMMIFSAAVLQHMPRKPVFFAIVAALVVVSAFHTLVGRYTSPLAGPENVQNPIYDFALEELMQSKHNNFWLKNNVTIFYSLLSAAVFFGIVLLRKEII